MTRRLAYDVFEDELGWALAVAADGALALLHHARSPEDAEEEVRGLYPAARHDPSAPPLPELRRQLGEYFAGARRDFDVPLAPAGTDFQRRVWSALCDIPSGETRSSAELARAVGRPLGFRAVGQANRRNPLGVVVPCHRVVAADGGLGGYAGGLDRKRTLLAIERGGARLGPSG